MADSRYYLMRKVVIFGCGWLGQQLGVALAAAGYQVFGTRQSAQSCALLPESIHPVVLQLPVVEFPFALVADAIVIVALPASTPNYLAALRQISDSCAKASQIFFCSSTGIYAGLTGHLTEAALPLPTALLELAAGSLATDYAQAIMAAKNPAALVQLSRVQRLLAAEIIMCQLENVVILRLAGLIGPGRHPANFTRHGALAGADLPVNMLHSYDIQRFLITWLRQPESSLVVNGVVNLCSPEHPTKQQFYQQACMDAGFKAPVFAIENQAAAGEMSRTIDVSRSLTLPGFGYRFVSPISAIAHCFS